VTKKNQHIIPIGKAWGVKTEGSKDLTIITSTKKQALEFGKKLARSEKSELIIHNRHGKISRKVSFKN
jgi:hypothetical protein